MTLAGATACLLTILCVIRSLHWLRNTLNTANRMELPSKLLTSYSIMPGLTHQFIPRNKGRVNYFDCNSERNSEKFIKGV